MKYKIDVDWVFDKGEVHATVEKNLGSWECREAMTRVAETEAHHYDDKPFDNNLGEYQGCYVTLLEQGGIRYEKK